MYLTHLYICIDVYTRVYIWGGYNTQNMKEDNSVTMCTAYLRIQRI